MYVLSVLNHVMRRPIDRMDEKKTNEPQEHFIGLKDIFAFCCFFSFLSLLDESDTDYSIKLSL